MKNLIIKVIFFLLLFPSLSFSSTPLHKRLFKIPMPKADIYIVPKPKTLPIILKYPAQIKSFKSIRVVSRVSGILEKKYFKEGQEIKKGDFLYKIEDKVYKAKVGEAKASVQMAQAILDNTIRNWDRVKKLYRQKAISQEKRDNALSAYEEAEASLSLSKAKLKQAQINLSYTRVLAPISGTIGLKKIDVGDYVRSNPPTTLINITNNKKIYVFFSMPLRDYINIKNGLWQIQKNKKIKIFLIIDGKTIKQQGIVNFIDSNVDKKTSVVKFRAILDNNNKYLMPGSFARVVLSGIVQKNVISIPQKALLQNPLGTVVFIVKNGRVRTLPIAVTRESGENYIVKKDYLKSGTKIIVNNFFRLRPGGKVAIDKIINRQEK